MAIEIIVEDGSGKVDSNSYVSIEYAKTFLQVRGVEVSDNDEIAIMLIKAIDYLESKCFKGEKTNPEQALAFPRSGVEINDIELPDDLIPLAIQRAQCQLVIAIESGLDLTGNVSAQDYIVKEKVGPIEMQYADPTEVGISVKLPLVDNLLKDLLCYGAGRVRTLRI